MEYVKQRLLKLLRNAVSDPDVDINLDTKLSDLFDEFETVEFILIIEKSFGINFNDNFVAEMKTIKELIETINAANEKELVFEE